MTEAISKGTGELFMYSFLKTDKTKPQCDIIYTYIHMQ